MVYSGLLNMAGYVKLASIFFFNNLVRPREQSSVKQQNKSTKNKNQLHAIAYRAHTDSSYIPSLQLW